MSKKKAKRKKIKRDRPTKLDRQWKKFTTGIIVLLLVFLVFGRVLIIRGSSMEPTYFNGNVLVGLRVFNANSLLEKNYPVCVVKAPNGLTVIKRLIGVPGDHVEIVRGDTYVNNELAMKRTTNSWDSFSFDLGEDDWLVIGDNRSDSYDGRYWEGNYVSSDKILYWVPGSELPVHVVEPIEDSGTE